MTGVWRDWLRVAAIWLNILLLLLVIGDLTAGVRLADGLENLNRFSVPMLGVAVALGITLMALFFPPRSD